VALQANCPVWQPRRIKKDETVLAALEELQADVFVVVAYGQLLSQRILDMPGWAVSMAMVLYCRPIGGRLPFSGAW
jgi:methionyl-tRNA formyltransferase